MPDLAGHGSEYVKAKGGLPEWNLAGALQNASRMAYQGLDNPVEGTMLTVMKEMAAATARYLDCADDSVTAVLQTAVESAGRAVANTPTCCRSSKRPEL